MQRRDSNAASVASKGRRMSKFYPGKINFHSEDSGSQDKVQRPPTRRYENTFKTEPDESNEFSPSAVQNICHDILTSTLDTVKVYDPIDTPKLVVRLTSIIKQAVKELNFPRYKIICNVILGENKNQGFQMASRCIWNEKWDNFACAQYKNDVIYALALVHGVYYE